jgi:predicted DNA-binding protein
MVDQSDIGYENTEQEGTKTLNVKIHPKTYSRLRSFSSDTEKSVSSIINEAVNNEITRCEVKQILAEKCE